MFPREIGGVEIWNDIILERTWEFAAAPYNNTELLPAVLPLIVGAVIIELYFGKHKQEVLGWNTSVGNAVIWVSTGLNLLLTEALETPVERTVAWLVLLTGAFTAYMDFFHKWSSAVAFKASSPDIIYPLAYVAVVAVKTEMPINETTLKGAAWFLVGIFVLFRTLKFFETPARDGFNNFQSRF